MVSILLVEDSFDLARVIKKELTAEGYRVLHAVDGETAIRLCDAETFDLIILDWMLPGMDGLEVLRQLRKDVIIPVLMLTARKEEIDRVLGLEMGADDYLTKPFSMRELIARVHALLRRIRHVQQVLKSDRSEQTEVLDDGGVRIDPQAFRAALDGEEFELTPIEFSLLHLFLRNPGRAFSRSYLLDTVWNSAYISGDRSVDNTILRLRRKLGRHGERIETVWGIGYRWAAR